MTNNHVPRVKNQASHAFLITFAAFFAFLFGIVAIAVRFDSLRGIDDLSVALFMMSPIVISGLFIALSRRSLVDQDVTLRSVHQMLFRDVPKRAQYLLLLIPQKNREFILGDLEEEFRTILLPQYGPRKAMAYYWWHTFVSLSPYIFRFFKRAIGVAVILKLIGK